MEIVHRPQNQLWNGNPSWCDVGREAFIAEVTRRRFHLVECSGQFIVICSDDPLNVLA